MSAGALDPSTNGGSRKTSDVAEMLARIDARLARLERAVAPAAELAEQLPNVVATATDIIDEHAAGLGDSEARLQALMDLLERLSRPQTLSSLGKLVDIAENAPNLVATFTDVVDEVMADAGEHGLELHQVFADSRRLLFGMLRLTTSPELRALLDSGMLDPRALNTLGQLAQTLVRVNERMPPRVGAFGALRALGNADVQRAVGFLLEIAAGFGRSLRVEEATRKRLPSG